MGKSKILESTLRRFNELANFNGTISEAYDRKSTFKEEKPVIKFAGTDLFESKRRRIANLMEYTIAPNGFVEEADDNDPNGGGGAPPMDGGMDGDPNGGGAPPMDGGMDGDPNGGGALPMDGGMGGDPNGGGGVPPMDGGMGGGPNGGGQGQGPEGFNPQVGDDSMGGDPNGGGMPPMDGGMGPNMGDNGMDGMQPDDEVVDITELTDKQDETEHKVEKLGDRFDKVFKAIGQFEELLRSNDEKIESLRTEFEKRNPTQIEKLSMQTDKSYPFSVKPEDFWKEKQATSNYSTEYDNNGKDQGQYAITAKDIKGDVDWKGIADSLDDDDFIYNQTLDGVLKI